MLCFICWPFSTIFQINFVIFVKDVKWEINENCFSFGAFPKKSELKLIRAKVTVFVLIVSKKGQINK